MRRRVVVFNRVREEIINRRVRRAHLVNLELLLLPQHDLLHQICLIILKLKVNENRVQRQIPGFPVGPGEFHLLPFVANPANILSEPLIRVHLIVALPFLLTRGLDHINLGLPLTRAAFPALRPLLQIALTPD